MDGRHWHADLRLFHVAVSVWGYPLVEAPLWGAEFRGKWLTAWMPWAQLSIVW